MMNKQNALHPVNIIIENSGEFLAANDYPLSTLKVSSAGDDTYVYICVMKDGTKQWVKFGSGGSYPGSIDASDVSFNNIGSWISAISVQGAIQEIASTIETIKNEKTYVFEKVFDHTYSINYDVLDYDNAYEYYLGDDEPIYGACSSLRKGNIFGRSYDWIYDNSCDFIVRTSNKNGRYKTIGFGGEFPELTSDFMKSGKYSDKFKLIPFKIVDGINEKGLVVSANVVPETDIKTTGTTPLIEKRETVCSRMLIRYILDKFDTAQHAVDYIKNYVSIYNHSELSDAHKYDLHIMIADTNNTFILEFINNELVVRDASSKAYMTNFALTGVRFNLDGSVYTPYTQSEGHDAIVSNNIHEYGAGLERFNIINESYAGLSDTNISNWWTLLRKLRYTNTYKGTGDSDSWFTEGVGQIVDGGLDIKVNSSLSDCNTRMQTLKSAYQNRSRDTGLTWQTIHSVMYDIYNKTASVIFQEDDNNTFVFSI